MTISRVCNTCVNEKYDGDCSLGYGKGKDLCVDPSQVFDCKYWKGRTDCDVPLSSSSDVLDDVL